MSGKIFGEGGEAQSRVTKVSARGSDRMLGSRSRQTDILKITAIEKALNRALWSEAGGNWGQLGPNIEASTSAYGSSRGADEGISRNQSRGVASLAAWARLRMDIQGEGGGNIWSQDAALGALIA